MKRGDIKIIIMVVLLTIASYLIVFFIGNSSDERVLRITQDQVIIHEVVLSDDYDNVFEIKYNDEYNRVIVKGKEVWIEEASCLNQVCVRHKTISKVGETIVCIPHKLIVEIIGEQQDLDVIVD